MFALVFFYIRHRKYSKDKKFAYVENETSELAAQNDRSGELHGVDTKPELSAARGEHELQSGAMDSELEIAHSAR